MAAGVHDARVLGANGVPVPFLHRQGVHIRPNGHPLAGLVATDAYHHPGLHRQGQHLEGRLGEQSPQPRRGLLLPAGKLRVLVELVPQGGQGLPQYFFSLL